MSFHPPISPIPTLKKLLLGLGFLWRFNFLSGTASSTNQPPLNLHNRIVPDLAIIQKVRLLYSSGFIHLTVLNSTCIINIILIQTFRRSDILTGAASSSTNQPFQSSKLLSFLSSCDLLAGPANPPVALTTCHEQLPAPVPSPPSSGQWLLNTGPGAEAEWEEEDAG